MMRGPVPPGYGPGGYDPRGGYVPRDPRHYDPHRHQAGPSPWIPATILGVILLITAMPYMRTPNPTIAYQTALRSSHSSFPLPVLWIPVLGVIALQFFGGGDWHHGYGGRDGYGRLGMRGGMYGGRPGYPLGGAYGGAPGAYASRGLGPDHYNRGWGGWWPWSASNSWNPHYRYNTHKHRGLMSTFMDYGGHWLLILLGIAVFTLVSSSTLPCTSPALPIPLAPHMLGFPWSLFF